MSSFSNIKTTIYLKLTLDSQNGLSTMTSLTFSDLIGIRKKSSNHLVNLIRRAENTRTQGEKLVKCKSQPSTNKFKMQDYTFPYIFSNLILTLSPLHSYYPHFTDVQVEAWKDEVNFQDVTVDHGGASFPNYF